MKYIFLSESFFNDYSNCPEIEQKRFRPYIMLLIEIEDLTFAIPLRSHIKHKFAFFTDINNRCGVDYSKAVVIKDKKYIDNKHPKIRQNEYKTLLNKSHIIYKEFSKYIEDYKNAVKNNANRKYYMYQYSTLQYFHKELGLE